MLSVQGLEVTLNNKRILKGVDLTLQKGESLVILGCSGTGKSVLLKAILGLVPKVGGTITLDGVNLDTAAPDEQEKALQSVGMLFQNSALFDSLPVWENIAFGLIYGQGMEESKAKALALEKMALVDLDRSVAKLYPASLSGGMMKRVALARSLALSPQVIFFDEPTTGLDPITGRIVSDLIVKSVKDSGIAAITITHDLQCLRRIADRVAFLFDGKVIWTGSLQGMDATENPYLRQFLDALPDGPLTDRK